MPICLRPNNKANKIAYAILGTPSHEKGKKHPNRIVMGLGVRVDNKIKAS